MGEASTRIGLPITHITQPKGLICVLKSVIVPESNRHVPATGTYL